MDFLLRAAAYAGSGYRWDSGGWVIRACAGMLWGNRLLTRAARKRVGRSRSEIRSSLVLLLFIYQSEKSGCHLTGQSFAIFRLLHPIQFRRDGEEALV